jgi:biopolymer transport protein ExbD
MKRILEVCLVVLAAITLGPSVEEQSSATTQRSFAKKTFAGTWKGSMNGLPGVDLTIQEADAKITGSIVFYFQERKDVNSPWQVTADYAVPLLATHVTGKILTFEVEHHVCHGCPERGPNVTFRMELAGPNQARLWRLEEDGTEGQQEKLIRENLASAQAAPAMQPGISVEMPVTKNATPVPDADGDDALIVTVTDGGAVYIGVRPVDLDVLTDELDGSLSNRVERKLYVKADARTAYANVVRVLDAARAAGVEAPILLTTQRDRLEPGAYVPPRGLQAVVGRAQRRAPLTP